MIVGDELSIQLRGGMDTRKFGPSWRFARLTACEIDVLGNGIMLVLDDGGPKVYLSDVTDLHVRE